MISFIKPKNLNGAELIEELVAIGVKIEGWPSDDGNGNLLLKIDPNDEIAAGKIVAAHNGNTIAIEATPAEKLFAATGLTVAEYKALGL